MEIPLKFTINFAPQLFFPRDITKQDHRSQETQLLLLSNMLMIVTDRVRRAEKSV